MEYFGREIGKLGFGAMRLPGTGTPDGIDIEETKKMVDAFMEAGFNYFDTAWAYTGSEDALRQALVERYPRDSYFITTKIAPWVQCKTREDMENQFEESLKALGLDYVDMLLVHNVGAKRTIPIEGFDAWGYLQEQKELGRAKHIGWSTHGEPEEIEEYLEKTPGCEMIQLQINYGDWENPGYRHRPCYEIVHEKGIPIVVMEPIKGGMLAKPPAAALEILEECVPGRTPVDWALRFPASLDGVACVLSGMSSLEQVQQNIETFKDYEGLTDDENAALMKAANAFWEGGLVPCTGCNYCAKVCPAGIGISGSLTALNVLKSYDDIKVATWTLGNLVRFNGHAMPNECTDCGACEEACPQNISIREELEKVCEQILTRMNERPNVVMKM